MDRDIPDEKIDEILLMVETTIKTEGYCRAGYAIMKVMDWNNKVATKTQRMKIAAKSTVKGKYNFSIALDKDYVDFNIYPNPEYLRLKLDMKLARKNIKADSRNKNYAIINIIFAIVNIVILVAQLLK